MQDDNQDAAIAGVDPPEALDSAREMLRQARRTVVLTGAGISTDSGIPDFRGPNGLWTKNPAAERTATLDAYMSDPELRRRAWRNLLASDPSAPEPNPGHLAIVSLERAGRLDTLVTQNVDGLHRKAGSDPAKLIEIHGTNREVVCMRCGARQPVEAAFERVQAGEEDLHCLAPRDGGLCQGVMKLAVISFGQNLVPEDLERAQEAASRSDLLLAVGSTLGVYPAAGLVPLAARAGATIIIVNAQPTTFDDIADLVLRGPISEVLPAIVEG